MKTMSAFDCVAFKRKAQTEIARRIKDLKPSEEVVWFQDRAAHGPFADWWDQITAVRRAQPVVAEDRSQYGAPPLTPRRRRPSREV
jgi:hypothetical protein